MITVQFIKTPCGRLFFSSQGHAAIAQGEINRVCAAASMLSFTLATALQEQGLDLQARQAAGLLCLTTADGRQARDTFRVINSGYRLLARRYPLQVQVYAQL